MTQMKFKPHNCNSQFDVFLGSECDNPVMAISHHIDLLTNTIVYIHILPVLWKRSFMLV